MKRSVGVLLALLLASGAASATKVPIPLEGATLNVSAQLQPRLLISENGAPDASDLGFETYIRRARLLVNGDAGPNFTYLYQIDMANTGRRGSYPTQANGAFAIVQDAWVGWAPTGITGPNVLYIDAGILLQPIAHHLLESTTNFTTADVHTDSFRIVAGMPGLRDPGIQLRGWALDKKVGFRGGVYEGFRSGYLATAPASGNNGTQLTPKSSPRFGGLVNIDLIGSEEGAWLYGANHWDKDMILTIGGAVNYQSQAVLGPNGVTDNLVASGDVFFYMPLSETQALTVEATGYRSNNGTGSADTGFGFFVDVSFRIGDLKPYVSYEAFLGDSCSDDLLANNPGVCTKVHTRETRVAIVGLDYFIDKNRNHVNLEFALNRGVSAIAPPAENNANTDKNLKTLLLHWNFIF